MFPFRCGELDRLAESTDLNPIQHLWDELQHAKHSESQTQHQCLTSLVILRLNGQPHCHNNCWQLKTADALKLYIEFGSILNFLLREHCAYDLATFRHKNQVARVRKSSRFVLKISVLPQSQLTFFPKVYVKISCGVLVTNVETQS